MKNMPLLALSSILVCAALFFSPAHSQSPTPTLPPTATITVAATMDALPTDCGQLAEMMPFTPPDGNGIGAWPVWAGLSNWSNQNKGVLIFPTEHYQTNDQLVGWWVTKMGWFVAESYKGEVKIQAHNVADHSPMYFENAEEPTTTAVLNPAQPGGFIDDMQGWAFFPTLIWVSKAGCYQLEVTWDGGMWQQRIAVGAVTP